MKEFHDTTILIMHSANYTRKVLTAILQILGVHEVNVAIEITDATVECNQTRYDLIIGEMCNGMTDGIALCEKLRNTPKSRNYKTPFMLIANPSAMHLLEIARDAGINDLIQAPYSPDNIAQRVLHAINIKTSIPIDDPQIPSQQRQIAQNSWPKDDESKRLTELLIDHYIRHHEIVLSKMRLAHEATKLSLEDLNSVRDNVVGKAKRAKTIEDFEHIWDQVIEMYHRGGLTEQDLSDVEKIVTDIPPEIKSHYDALTEKHRGLMNRIEKLNKMGYARAKERVYKVQALPNPLTGKTAQEYDLLTQSKIHKKGSEPIKTYFYDSMDNIQVVDYPK